jgi:hypothetical protein
MQFSIKYYKYYIIVVDKIRTTNLKLKAPHKFNIREAFIEYHLYNFYWECTREFRKNLVIYIIEIYRLYTSNHKKNTQWKIKNLFGWNNESQKYKFGSSSSLICLPLSLSLICLSLFYIFSLFFFLLFFY